MGRKWLLAAVVAGFICLAFAAASEDEIQLYVGQLLKIALPDGARVFDLSGEDLPKWLFIQNKTLFGIADDEGAAYIKVLPRLLYKDSKLLSLLFCIYSWLLASSEVSLKSFCSELRRSRILKLHMHV